MIWSSCISVEYIRNACWCKTYSCMTRDPCIQRKLHVYLYIYTYTYIYIYSFIDICMTSQLYRATLVWQWAICMRTDLRRWRQPQKRLLGIVSAAPMNTYNASHVKWCICCLLYIYSKSCTPNALHEAKCNDAMTASERSQLIGTCGMVAQAMLEVVRHHRRLTWLIFKTSNTYL